MATGHWGKPTSILLADMIPSPSTEGFHQRSSRALPYRSLATRYKGTVVSGSEHVGAKNNRQRFIFGQSWKNNWRMGNYYFLGELSKNRHQALQVNGGFVRNAAVSSAGRCECREGLLCAPNTPPIDKTINPTGGAAGFTQPEITVRALTLLQNLTA